MPDGRVASASADGTARLWTLPQEPGADVTEPFLLSGHQGPIHALAVTPDGQTLLTGGEDMTVRLWHAADGKLKTTFEGLHKGPVLAPGDQPQGGRCPQWLRGQDGHPVRSQGGEVLRTLTSHQGPVRSVAFGPDGERIVTAGEEGGLKVWDPSNGAGVIAFGHAPEKNPQTQPLQRVAFLGNGSLVSASADKTLKTWSFEGTWTEARTLDSHVFRVLSIDFSPDGKKLATGGGEPSRSGEVKIWDLTSGDTVFTLDELHSDTVFGVRFSPDGSKLATAAADKFMKVVNATDGKELKSFEGHTHHVMAVDWKSDGKQLVTGGADNVLKVWNFETGEQVRTLRPAGKQITDVRWVPEKPIVAAASGDQNVRFWNPDNGGVTRTFSGPADYVFGIAVSQDASLVAAGGADGILFVWNGENGQVLRKLAPPEPAPTETAATGP